MLSLLEHREICSRLLVLYQVSIEPATFTCCTGLNSCLNYSSLGLRKCWKTNQLPPGIVCSLLVVLLCEVCSRLCSQLFPIMCHKDCFTHRLFLVQGENGCNKSKKTAGYLLVSLRSQAKIAVCGDRYDHQLFKYSSE